MAEPATPVPSRTTPLPKLADVHEGDAVGRYRIERFLGEGGMARVYAVRHEDTGHRAALKLPKLGLDAEFRDRFLLEARAHLSLNGKRHIVSPLETGTLPEPDGRPYLIMQWVEGVTLDVFMQQPERRTEEPEVQLARSIRFVIQMAMALGEAHRQKPPIVHRDLKPSNVYVLRDDEVNIEGRDVEYVLLGDFGLAWRRGDRVSAVGTPEYCSPEQAADEPPTPRSDFYSLGVMLFELIEGTLPFRHDDVVTLLSMHRATPPPPLKNPHARELQELVSKLLKKRWEERPADAKEIVNALSSALRRLERRDQETAIKRVPGLESPPTEELPRLPALPTTKLPPVEARPPSPSMAALVRDVKVANRRPIVVGGLLLLLLGGVLGAVRLFTTEPVVETPPPIVQAAPLAPIPEVPPAPPVEPDELAPVAPGVTPKPNPKPTPVAAAPKCEPSPEWKELMRGNLEALEEHGRSMPAGELATEVVRVGRLIVGAETPRDCAKAIAEYEALKKRAMK